MLRLPRTVPKHPFRLDLVSHAFNGFSRLISGTFWLPSLRPYNVTICHEKRFIWFRVAKTGTRSLLSLLRSNDIRLDAEHPMDVHYPVSAYQDYFKFAFVRNPWDRLVSAWRNKVVDRNWWNLPEDRLRHLRQFPNFVDHVSDMDLTKCDVHLRLQSSVIDLNNLDYLARFEDFETEVDTLFDHLGLTYARIPVRNASHGTHSYRHFYTYELVKRVGHLYRKDVQVFRYQF